MTIRLVCRMDDAGSCPSANDAIAEVLAEGYARNVSVMPCCKHFDAAADMLKGFPDACVGLHMTLNSEWEDVKWAPVLPPQRVPSLLDDSGYLLPTPKANHERGVDAEQIAAEMAAQLQKMRDAGLDVRYYDLHMGFDWLDGVAALLDELGRQEGLIKGHRTLARLPAVEGERPEDPGEELLARLKLAADGDYLLVAHPGYDRPDMRRMGHAGDPPGKIARDRDRQRRLFLSPQVARWASEHDVAFVRYTDVLTAEGRIRGR